MKLESIKKHPILALTGELWGVFVMILENIDRMITVPPYALWMLRMLKTVLLEILQQKHITGNLDSNDHSNIPDIDQSRNNQALYSMICNKMITNKSLYSLQ